MPIVRLVAALMSDIADDIITRLDAGSGPARIKFYTGTMPATPATPPGGGNTLLGTLTCSDPCATQTGGVITFAAVTQDAAADASGTAAWARFEDSNGNGVIDGDVTGLAGTGAVKMNTTDIVVGGPIQINSVVITIAGG